MIFTLSVLVFRIWGLNRETREDKVQNSQQVCSSFCTVTLSYFLIDSLNQ